jgi:hypothetical protein
MAVVISDASPLICLETTLDPGEAEAIALAVENKPTKGSNTVYRSAGRASLLERAPNDAPFPRLVRIANSSR